MPESKRCPSPELLSEFAVGRTNDALAVEIETHLAACLRCVAALDGGGVDSLVEAVKSHREVDEIPIDPLLMQRFQALLPQVDHAETTSATVAVPQETYVPLESVEVDATEDQYSFLPPSSVPGVLGQLGGYRVLKPLGKGGMGVVFLAEDEHLQRRVALKVMRPQVLGTQDGSRRFLAEARAAAKLKHDHVVTIYQVGEDGGVPYLAMELLEGESLESHLSRVQQLSVDEACRIGIEAAGALSAAQNRGLVHRDIKPANLWLEAGSGRVKVLDFGLARATESDMQCTATGAIVGTPAYMAPEQARGDTVDGRTDLFALGVVLYRALVGRVPFRGNNAVGTLLAVTTHAPVPPRSLRPEIPQRLSDLVLGLLEKDPSRRPQSAAGVADELKAIRAETGPAQPPRKSSRTALAAGFFATCAVLAAVTVIFRDQDGNKIAEVTVPGSVTAEVRSSPQPAQQPSGKTGIQETAPLVPDLKEWLNGRPVLTVSQDGSGQFKTIQAALAALKPGQAVQIQDRGPYRENLKVTDLPPDTGLFSSSQTIIECPGWQEVYQEPPDSTGRAIQVYSGHILNRPKGFRLHGLEWRFASRGGRTIQPLTLLETTGLTIEQCVFRATDGDDVQFVNVTNHGVPNPPAASIVVRDCLFETQLWLNSRGENSRFLVERNLFVNPAQLGSLVIADSRTSRLAVRHNVFSGQISVPMMTVARPLACENLEIVNNTFDSATAMQFVGQCPSRGTLAIRNNILTGSAWFVIVTDEVKDSAGAYLGHNRLGENAFMGPLTGPAELPAPIQTAGDYREQVSWLSTKPEHPDFLRIDAEFARKNLPGAGRGLATYRGALPPGPSPAEGDWFSRLLNRWKTPAPVPSTPHPVINRLTKLPSLEEWLKGRTVLTVSREGKGQFTSIQAALEQVASGQAVEVLDQGPYRERLSVRLPADCGLFSRVQTVLDFEDWVYGWPGDPAANGEPAKVYLGNDFIGADRFRLHGFDFHFPPPKGTYEEGHVHQRVMVRSPKDCVIENCRFGRSGKGCFNGEPIMLSNWDTTNSTEMSVVMRDCVIDGSVDVNTHSQLPFPPDNRKGVFLFEHNVFPGTGIDHHLLVAGQNLQRFEVRECLFAGFVPQNVVLNDVSEVASIGIRNCVLNGTHGVYFGNKVPVSGVTIRNNLRMGDGIVVFGQSAGEHRDRARRDWDVDHNAYGQVRLPNHPPVSLRPAVTDVMGYPNFTAMALETHDAFRLAADDKLGRAGAGGADSSHMGPFPPGPPPAGGDWFTRLQKRWLREARSSGQTSSTPLAEPPPLDE